MSALATWLTAAVVLASPLERTGMGDWVTYEVDGGAGRLSYIRFAAVGLEADAKGRPAVWLEMEVSHHPSFAAPIARLAALTARSEGLTEGGVSRLLLAVGAGAPVELAPEELSRFWPVRRQPSAPPPAGGGWTLRTRSRTVQTAAGPTPARCSEAVAQKAVVHVFCASEAVPILGLVELSMPLLGQSVRLHAAGTAASRRMPIGSTPSSIREAR